MGSLSAAWCVCAIRLHGGQWPVTGALALSFRPGAKLPYVHGLGRKNRLGVQRQVGSLIPQFVERWIHFLPPDFEVLWL